MATGLENLKIYQIAEDLEVELHEITSHFPKDELYRSVDQIRRSSSSVPSSIAEGYARYSFKEKIRYMHIARGEAEETKRHAIKSRRKGFMKDDDANRIADKYTEFIKGINGYINFLRRQQEK